MAKYILITGSSRGIGKAIKEVLEKNNEYICLTPNREVLDLNNQKSVDKYLVNISKYNIYGLVNCAGINIIGDINSIEDVQIDDMFNINLKTPLKLIKAVSKIMKENNCGKIVNISSIWGIRSKEYRTLYSSTKFALNGITKSLARELGRYNILVNSIAPGYINTEMTQQNVSKEEQLKIKETIPLNRFGEPEEIAKLVEFLISENNSYITGETITIDGGFLA